MSPLEGIEPKRLRLADFSVGDRVCVQKNALANYISLVSRRMKGREGVVTWVAKYETRAAAALSEPCYMAPINRVEVKFLSKTPRGKDFVCMLLPSELEILPQT